MPNTHISVAYSTHRPETLPFAKLQMQQHDAIFLEEPSVPGFQAMLEGTMAIEDYVLLTDTEYPEFTVQIGHLLRKLYRQGKRIFQVEPFLDDLLGIHEHLARGGKTDDIAPGSTQSAVYHIEKTATGHLLAYYQRTIQGSFASILKAVQRFARADAARFRLRDQMRATAIASKARSFRSTYVEAGEMHLALWPELKKRLPARSRLERVYLMAPVVRKICGRNRMLGPGDQLTAHYIFSGRRRMRWEDLMAGRSLIYNKILQKDELVDTSMDFPHTRSEIQTIRAVRGLSLEDCRSLFKRIRYSRTEAARGLVAEYLAARSGG